MHSCRGHADFVLGITPAAVVAALALAGCTNKPTALVLAIATDANIPAEVSRVEILVTRPHGAAGPTEVRFHREYALGSDATLPGTLTLANEDAEVPEVPLTIVVVGGGLGQPEIRREVRLGMVSEKTKLLRVHLDRACLGVVCVDGLTCSGAVCISPDVDPTTLPDFASNDDANGAGAAGTNGAGGAGAGGGAHVSGAGWPMFQHDAQRTGRSDVNGPQTAKTPSILGNATTLASPVVGPDGTVYFHDTGLTAMSPAGMKRWSFAAANAYVGAAAAVDPSGVVYAGSNKGDFYSLASDGTVRWSLAFSDQDQPTPATIAPDGTIHFAKFDTMYAYAPDGTQRWATTLTSRIYGHALGADGTVYVSADSITDPTNVFALSAKDGTQVWSVPTDQGVRAHPAVGPDGTVYFQSIASTLYAVTPDGMLKWKAPTGQNVISSVGTDSAAGPVVGADGTVYVASTTVDAFSPDGALKWTLTLPSATANGAAMGADGTLYVVTAVEVSVTAMSTGALYAISPDGTQKWVGVRPGPFLTPPAIGTDGTLYVSNDEGVLAFPP